MNEDHPKLVEDIFQQAADLPDEQRRRFLDEHCGSNKALRSEVELLLRHEAQAAPTFLAGRVPCEKPGTMIGRYKILKPIGEGAYGDVYLAQQTGPLRREVALKIVKLGMDTRQVVARFEAERQALALMDHPHIAQVYDAGATDTGRPYFAMEYVPGVSITAYCDQEKLNTDDRLRLFGQVCDAVQHAHQKGIIHRDLKPSNILVEVLGKNAIPKVIDFGIAKATGFSLTERTLYTEEGQLIGTPEYMSPEQADMSGLNIDTRTDIYSLGVVLYELLAGAPPFDPKTLRRGTIQEIQRRIREEEPPTPSTRLSRLGDDSAAAATSRRTDPHTLRRRLKGDLDWITMKAMAKERSRRYAAASELAADIDRHLKNEPVLAGPPSAVYRLSKFTRRNKAVVTGVTVAAAAMVLGTALAIWQAARAGAEATKAVTIKTFLAETLGATDFMEAGRRLSVGDVLDRAVKAIPQAFAGRPELEAEVRHLLGVSYFSMSEFEKSFEQLRASFELRERILGPEHADTLQSAADLAEALGRAYHWGEAEILWRRVIEARRRTLGKAHPDTLWSMSRLSWPLVERHKFDEAETMARRAAEGLVEVLGEQDERAIRACAGLYYPLWHAGKLDEAEAAARRARTMAQRALPEDHLVRIRADKELGRFLAMTGGWTEAEPLIRSALAANRRLFGDLDYQTLSWTDMLGAMLHQYAKTEEERREGDRLVREAIEGMQQAFGEDHLHTAYAFLHLGTLERRQDDYDAAAVAYRRCLEIQRARLGDDHPHVANTMARLGWVLTRLEEDEKGEALLRDALDRHRALISGLGRDRITWGHWDALATMSSLASYLGERERYEDAALIWKERLELLRSGLGEDNSETLRTIEALADLYDAWGKPHRAAEWRAKVDQN